MFVRSAFAVAVALQLAACAMPTLPSFLRFEGSKLDWDAVTLTAAANANRNTAVAVDVVLALDAGIAQRLQEMTADKWFAERVDLQKTFPAGVKYLSWELVPGQTLSIPGSSLERPRVMEAYAFANYMVPGAHRQRIEVLKGALVVRLNEKNFEVIQTP